MTRGHDRVGAVHALTVFAAIIPGHTEAVREVIESLPRAGKSPLARIPTLHFSRIQIFDHLVYQEGGQKPDKLESDYLVFTSSFDGKLDPYLDAICDLIPAEADSWWSHCVGYPGTSDRAAFKRYIKSHHRPSALFAPAYPKATLPEVNDALALREKLVDFIAETQGLGAAELKERFTTTFAEAR